MKREFKQDIISVNDTHVIVESPRGNRYPVIISDHARANPLFETVEYGDKAIVHRVHGEYYLYDIQKNILRKDDIQLDEYEE